MDRFDDLVERLAAYQYLEDVVGGQRVLELGCGNGLGTLQLLALGATEVVAHDRDVRAARRLLSGRDEASVMRWRPPRLKHGDGAFGLVVVADAELIRDDPAVLDELVRVAGPEGRVAVYTPSGDHPDREDQGLSYGELLDLLEPRFGRVRIVGQCPFVGYSLVELTEASGPEPDVQLDGALMGGNVEDVVAYVALAEPAGTAAEQRPYGILQVPVSGAEGLEDWQEWALDAEQVAAARAEAEAAAAEAAAAQDARAEPESAAPPTGPAVALKRFTDRAGGRILRWRWPG